MQADIPYLLAGPNVLASKIGGIVAVFLPTVEELRDQRLLRLRLSPSRLALPDKTTTLLVVPATKHDSFLSETFGLFTLTVT